MLLLWHFKRDAAVGDVRKGSRGFLGTGYQASDFQPSWWTVVRKGVGKVSADAIFKGSHIGPAGA